MNTRLPSRITAIGAFAAALLLLLAVPFGSARAETQSAVSISTAGGFARLIFLLPREASADAKIVDGVLAIPLPKSIAFTAVRLPQRLKAYVQAVARDGDALRLTLAAKVTVNVMAAGSKLYVDLLPESWTGLPPGLPPEMIAELARAAQKNQRVAEKSKAVVIAAPSAPAPAIPTPAVVAAPVVATLSRAGDVVRIELPFAAPTRAALFRRGEQVWIVFDGASAIDISALGRDPGRLVRSAELFELADGRALRIALGANWHAGIEAQGTRLVIAIAEREIAASRTLALDRIVGPTGRVSAFLPLAAAGRVHRIPDPDSGGEIVVVTAALPARGLAREQSLVDFQLLPSAHGLALLPRADDLAVEVAPDGVVIDRPGGLHVSDDGSVASIPQPGSAIFGALGWQVDRAARFRPREAELVGALNAAPAGERNAARQALARFYLAHELGAEAKGVLDAGIRTRDGAIPEPADFAMRGLAHLLLGRAREAVEDLARPALANAGEAHLIRAAALTAAGRFGEAREAFRAGERDLSALPAPLQRMVRMAALRAAIELDDVDAAGALLHLLELREAPGTVEPRLALLAGRLAARLGRHEAAANFFAAAEHGADEAAAAEARFRQIELRLARNELSRQAAIRELETLAQNWSGDETEAATRRLLTRLYAAEARGPGAVLDPQAVPQATAELPRR